MNDLLRNFLNGIVEGMNSLRKRLDCLVATIFSGVIEFIERTKNWLTYIYKRVVNYLIVLLKAIRGLVWVLIKLALIYSPGLISMLFGVVLPSIALGVAGGLWIVTITVIGLCYGKQTPKDTQSSNTESEDNSNASSRFSSLQKCAIAFSAILIACLFYITSPFSRSIYDSVRKRLTEAPPRSDVADTARTAILSEAAIIVEEHIPDDGHADWQPTLQSDTLTPSPDQTLSSPLVPTPAKPTVEVTDITNDLPAPAPPPSVATGDDEDTPKKTPLVAHPANPYGALDSSPRPFLELSADGLTRVDGVIYDYSPPDISEREFRHQLIKDGVYSATLTSLPTTRKAAKIIKEELASRNIILTIEELAEDRPPYLANRASVLYYSDNNRELANVLATRFSKLSGIEFSATRGATPPLGPHLRFAIHCVPEQ